MDHCDQCVNKSAFNLRKTYHLLLALGAVSIFATLPTTDSNKFFMRKTLFSQCVMWGEPCLRGVKVVNVIGPDCLNL